VCGAVFVSLPEASMQALHQQGLHYYSYFAKKEASKSHQVDHSAILYFPMMMAPKKSIEIVGLVFEQAGTVDVQKVQVGEHHMETVEMGSLQRETETPHQNYHPLKGQSQSFVQHDNYLTLELLTMFPHPTLGTWILT